MGFNKIIKNLELIFNEDKIDEAHAETLDGLLLELEKQKDKIKAEIDSESNKKKRKKLKMKLKIIKVQIRKGYSKRDAIKGS